VTERDLMHAYIECINEQSAAVMVPDALNIMVKRITVIGLQRLVDQRKALLEIPPLERQHGWYEQSGN